MERALFISKVENLKFVNSEYTRLYFGNEFCQYLIPSLEDCRIIMDFVLKHKMDFSLVTPYVTDKGIQALMPVLECMIRNFSDAEIVINDWGLLRVLKEEFDGFNPVLGRLLTKQKRGPRILDIESKVPAAAMRHFKESNIDVPILSDFLIDNGISRIELDNLLQGVARENPSLKASLYFPFVYVSTSRFCLAASSEVKTRLLRSITTCNRQCRKYTFRLRHRNMPVDLLLKGNTQFFKNEHLPDNLGDLNIDRIVYEPEIPN